MEKKTLNSSKLQRIVSVRGSSEDDDDKLLVTTSSTLSAASNSNSLFSTQHDILKYSSAAASSTKQLITKRHMTSSLNNLDADSSSKVMHSSQTGSISRKIISSSSNSSSKEDIEYTVSNSASTTSNKPLRKIAVVNSNNMVYKSNLLKEISDDTFQQQMYKSSSSSIIFNRDTKNSIDFDSFAGSSATAAVSSTNASNKITASTWRAGEVLVQKQLKQHLKQQQQQLKQVTTPTTSSATSSSEGIDLTRRHLFKEVKELMKSPPKQLKSKRSEFHSVPSSSVSTTTPNTTQQQIKSKVSNLVQQSPKQISKSLLKSYNHTSDLVVDDKHKKQIKRIYETKAEKLKREEEERKHKLQEIYRKQQQQQQRTTKDVSKLMSSSNAVTSNITANDPKQLISNKYLYEQDMSKILLDKITHLLNDNDKLVEKQRQQIKHATKYEDTNDDTNTNETINDDDDEEIEANPLRNLTNFDENKKPHHDADQRSTYMYKHDRLKKICSMALDLQTKLQQTKLKLFGLNPNDESILYYGNNVNNLNEDDYDDENRPVVTSKKSQVCSSAQSNTNTKPQLTPNMAARRIQIAYRRYLNRRRLYLKKNQQHHINLLKYNNMNDDLKRKQHQQLIKKSDQLQHIHNQYADDANDDFLKKKLPTSNKYKSLIKTTMEQNDLIYDTDYTADDLIRNNSKKLIINNLPIQPVKSRSKSRSSNRKANDDESISSEESISTSTSSSSTNHSSSTNNTTSNTLTNGSLTSLKSNKNKSYELKVSSPTQRLLNSNKQLKLQNKLRSLSYSNENATKEAKYSPVEPLNYLDTSDGQQEIPTTSKSLSNKELNPDYEMNNRKFNLPKRSLSANASSISYIDDTNKKLTSIDTISDLMGSVHIGDNRRATIGLSIEDDDELEKSFRALLPSESHLKKTKQIDSNKEHSFLYSMNDMSQTSFLSQFDNQNSMRISFEDDSFKKFTGEIVKKYMQEEEMRSKHQANLLKLREKALIDKTNAELTWLEQMKKKAQDKGEDEKMPSILKKEKGIMQKLKEEQESINQMKEVQRKATENRLKILSQHSEVIKWCQNKLKKHNNTSLSSLIADSSSLDSKNLNPDTTDYEELMLTEPNNQLDESSNINQSLIESKVLKQVKQHLNSEKYLTEREKKLRLRRKHAEEIIAWKKKLDDEELQVREIEKKANLALISKNDSCLLMEPPANALTTIQQAFSNKLKTNDDESTMLLNNQKNECTEISVNNAIILEKKNDKLKQTETITCITSYSAKKTKQLVDETQPNECDLMPLATLSNELKSDSNEDTKSNAVKVKELKNELIQKKNEAEKLKQTLKTKEKSKLKQKEDMLRKKISSYDNLIDKIKTALDDEAAKQVNDEPMESIAVKTTDDLYEVKTELAQTDNETLVSEDTNKQVMLTSELDVEQTSEMKSVHDVEIEAVERLKELKEKFIDLKIPYSKEKVEYLCDLAIENYYWNMIESKEVIQTNDDAIINNQNLIDYFDTRLEDTDKQTDIEFKKMLLDLIGELVTDLYLEQYEEPVAMFKFLPNIKKYCKKVHFKSHLKGPAKKSDAKLLVKNKIDVLLRYNDVNNNNSSISELKSKWRLPRRLDLVDSILENEMREQDYEWSNYEFEEYEAKILISNTIFDMVLKDTIDCFQVNFSKKINNI